jgi:predicted PurR-regulated permease PerM
MPDAFAEKLVRNLMLAVLLGGLLLLSYIVLRLFIVPVTWAMILAFASWPIHARLQARFPSSPTLCALAMTLLLSAALVLPALWMAMLLRDEAAAAITAVTAQLRQGPLELPQLIRGLPWAGERLQSWIGDMTGSMDAFRAQIGDWAGLGANHLLVLIGDVGRNAAKIGVALVTVFFVFRDGASVLAQVHRVLHRFMGARVDNYLAAVGGMTNAVVWGLVATALAQGFVAGLGYWWAGISAPVLFGAMTALIAMVPFGTPIAWGSISILLLLSGDTAAGIGLLLWGALVVSSVDNVIRPLVISSATRIPFLLVMFGVLGGLAAFGLVGLFLGPIILAVLMAVWREWLEEADLGVT